MNTKYSIVLYRRTVLILFMLISILLLISCTPKPVTPTQAANLPNPASVYCEQQGNRLEIRTNADGSQSGVCILPDGSECDEWAYLRGECQPGDTPAVPEPTSAPAISDAPAALEPTATPVATEQPQMVDPEVASDGCRIYRNETLGYSFHYPADARIVANDDPLRSFSVEGPLVDGEIWPQITISHPNDREDYRPPENADLIQWLTDHNLLGEDRLEDVQIAGTTAIHLRHEPSAQSYAFDRYYFAHAGQLYMVLIGHAGNKEDWELYNHFLQSFQFEQ